MSDSVILLAVRYTTRMILYPTVILICITLRNMDPPIVGGVSKPYGTPPAKLPTI